ncbi:chemotaxis protein CheB [Dactylosporangium vinaceum]|uniref:protein-glutamate methylesterase n=1 Tax=Dactylosporangium vinaceum TaxID=53362 RepID=A0ABV5MJT1_9ACTN|nr:chemotaxis protein CheB [Dactylosporangium vinaceum]UAB92700.1 chemotaxis protein CheB [Dactylosporangium vinaceum]
MSAGTPGGPAVAEFDVAVIAASLGGPAALRQVLAAIPADFPVPLLVAQHRPPELDGRFVEALQARTRLAVRTVGDEEPLATPGVGVLPPRHTATVDPGGRLRLRAADSGRTADPLLESAAAHCGHRALCVVLTGRLEDGAAGVRAIKRHGGRTIVQQPSTAQAPGMPKAALATGCVDLVMPLSHIAAAMIALTMAPGAADLFRVAPPSWADLAA